MVFITNEEYKELLEIKFKYELEHEKENCDCEGTVEEIKTVAEVREKEATQHKFKVGDKVIGNTKATEKYCFTKEGWIGTVEKTTNDDFTANGYMYLDYACFDLYKEREEN